MSTCYIISAVTTAHSLTTYDHSLRPATQHVHLRSTDPQLPPLAGIARKHTLLHHLLSAPTDQRSRGLAGRSGTSDSIRGPRRVLSASREHRSPVWRPAVSCRMCRGLCHDLGRGGIGIASSEALYSISSSSGPRLWRSLMPDPLKDDRLPCCSRQLDKHSALVPTSGASQPEQPLRSRLPGASQQPVASTKAGRNCAGPPEKPCVVARDHGTDTDGDGWWTSWQPGTPSTSHFNLLRWAADRQVPSEPADGGSWRAVSPANHQMTAEANMGHDEHGNSSTNNRRPRVIMMPLSVPESRPMAEADRGETG